MPQYYADGAYFHTNPTSQEKILTFQDVPMIVSTHFKAFIRYKVVDFNSLNWDVYFFMSTMAFGGGGGFGANAILQLYRNGASNTETILFTPTGRINTNVGTGTILNPWAGEWTTVMIDWEQQNGQVHSDLEIQLHTTWNMGPMGYEYSRTQLQQLLARGQAIVMVQEVRFPLGARQRVKNELKHLHPE